MQSFSPQGKLRQGPIRTAWKNVLDQTLQTGSADVGEHGEPDETKKGDLDDDANSVRCEDKASKGRQELSVEHPFENSFVGGKDFDAKQERHEDRERSDRERQHNQ